MYKNKENNFTGLTEEEVRRSREEHGSNKLPDVKGVNGNTDEVLKYEIKNVCVVNLGSKIYTIQFGDNFTQEDYINRYHGLFGNSLDKDKTICTLSTCTNFGRQRLVVQGSLINRGAE